jgi:hypothetical protein
VGFLGEGPGWKLGGLGFLGRRKHYTLVETPRLSNDPFHFLIAVVFLRTIAAMALGSKKQRTESSAASPPEGELLSRADRFLRKLGVKVESTSTVVRNKDLDRIDVTCAELKVYASHVEGRLNLPDGILEPQGSQIRAALDQLIQKLTRTGVESASTREAILQEANVLLGTINASRDLITSQEEGPIRKMLSVGTALLGFVPLAILGPDILAVILAGALGYVGLNGTVANFILALFRKNKHAKSSAPDTDDAELSV